MRPFLTSLAFAGALGLALSARPAAAEAEASADAAAVLAATRAAYGEGCWALTDMAAESGAYSEPPVAYPVTVPGETAEIGPLEMTVWQVFCDAGAYNLSHVYWLEGPYEGLTPLAFPMPQIEVVLERPEDFESPVREVKLKGWTAVNRLVNSSFDPATLTFSHYGKWRGLGDAFDAASWVLMQDGASIRSFEVDPSYDEQQTPVVLYPAP